MVMPDSVAIHWFRQDLRLADNPAFTQAVKHGKILPIYISDDAQAGDYRPGAASRWWLHYALGALNASLGNRLSVYCGDAQAVLDGILARFAVEAVYWNRCYEPWRIARDTRIKATLRKRGIKVGTYNGALLWEPWQVKKDDGTPYQVFTPFYRKGCCQAQAPRTPLPEPDAINAVSDHYQVGIHGLGLLPTTGWDKPLRPHWQMGEASAHKRFNAFIDAGLSCYEDGRNFPAKPYVSRLSPALHFGEVSPHQLWHRLSRIGEDAAVAHFCRELAWREFSYSQLYYHPTLPRQNLQSKFDAFPWLENADHLRAWQAGQTGIPMVDAGMRELWQTGYMHNRVRMVVGSFLVKNLRLHWHHGERWFWDTLVDADLANNSAGWQWVAGCGADAAPYFRIFNPVTQGQKFDADGDYVRRYVPEIAGLANRYLFNPWAAPTLVLKAAGIVLGATYPKPMVDLKQSRQAALTAFQTLKQVQA